MLKEKPAIAGLAAPGMPQGSPGMEQGAHGTVRRRRLQEGRHDHRLREAQVVSRSEHTTPYDALALVLDGAMTFTVGGKAVAAGAGTIVRLPASVPHGVDTTAASRMLLIMLKETAAG